MKSINIVSCLKENIFKSLDKVHTIHYINGFILQQLGYKKGQIKKISCSDKSYKKFKVSNWIKKPNCLFACVIVDIIV